MKPESQSPSAGGEQTLDSLEEAYFSWWLDELREAGFIREWRRAASHELFPPVTHSYVSEYKTPKTGQVRRKTKSKKLLSSLTYTPDFEIVWSLQAYARVFVPMAQCSGADLLVGDPGCRMIAQPSGGSQWTSIVEVKPRIVGRSSMNTGRLQLARATRAALFHLKGIYVHQVEIGTNAGSWFDKTFVPDRFLLTNKTGKPRTINFPARSLGSFLQGQTKLLPAQRH